jgi:hypothetical protein
VSPLDGRWSVQAATTIPLPEEARPRERVNPVYDENERLFEVSAVRLVYAPTSQQEGRWNLVTAEIQGMQVNNDNRVGRLPASWRWGHIEIPEQRPIHPEPPAPGWLLKLVDEHRPEGSIALR